MTTITPWVDSELRSRIDSDALAEVLAATWATFVDPDTDLVPVPPDAARLAMVAEVAVTGSTPALISLGIDYEGARTATRAMGRRGVGGRGRDEDDRLVTAMGQLVNALADRVRELLPEGSTLARPGVSTRTVDAGGGWPRIVVQLAWGRHVVTATAEEPTPDYVDARRS